MDTAAGAVRENQAVLIEDEKVKAVGPAADISKGIPPETRVIDLGNATILPGLIDCHTHITSQPLKHSEIPKLDVFFLPLSSPRPQSLHPKITTGISSAGRPLFTR